MSIELSDRVENEVGLGFFMVKNAIIESFDLTLGAFWLYACLSKYSFGKGHCFPSVRTLAKLARSGPKESGVSEQAIRNWTDELISKKLISVSEQLGKGKLYTLLEVDITVTPQPRLTPQPGLTPPLNQGWLDPSTRVDPNNKKIRRRNEEPKVVGFELPDWIPQDTWAAFREMRTKIKKPLTDFACKLTVADLLKLQASGQDPIACLNQSIQRCYQGVFPLSQNGNGHRPERRLGCD